MQLRSGISPSMTPEPNSRMEHLRSVVLQIPQEPGVYRWKSADGELLYVGKAKNLKRRLLQYTARKPRVEHFRKRALLENIADLEVTFTSSEMEALILEMHLIRTLKPRYNVSLTRERHYAYIRVTTQEDFPSVCIVNRKELDGNIYLGPYTNVWMQRRMLELLRMLYKFRTCGMRINLAQRKLFSEEQPLRIPLELHVNNKDRRIPCLDYHIKQCGGPCTGELAPDDYRIRSIEPVLAFYRGNTSSVIDLILTRMKEAAGERKFERASELRDLLSYLEQMQMQKKLFDVNAQSIDAFGFAKNVKSGIVLQVRGGNLANEERLTLETPDPDQPTMLAHVLTQFYSEPLDVPDVIAVPALPQNAGLLRSWFSREAKKKVSIVVPKSGEYKRLLALARTNALRRVETERLLSEEKKLVYT